MTAFSKSALPLLLILSVFFLPYQVFADQNPATPSFKVQKIETLKIPVSDPALPDISKYTYQNLLAMLPPLSPKTAVSIQGMASNDITRKFTETGHQDFHADKQKKKETEAVILSSGVTNLAQLYTQLNDPFVLERVDDIYTLKKPLAVGSQAALVIGSPDKRETLRLDSNGGSFIANAGKLFIINADVTGWDSANNKQHLFTSKEDFRPFITSWHQAQMYIAQSKISSLGYANGKSYGITYSTNYIKGSQLPPDQRPTGWIIDSEFSDMYYGFYCFEAEGIAILRNKYNDNIVYGIDPHDRSNHLIIGYNEATGTKIKHGIIISREVNDSWIFNNRSHNNNGSGIMLDRSSIRNVVAFNNTRENKSDGITLFESSKNLIWKNRINNNKRDGIRVRNSTDISVLYNTIEDNGKNGAALYTSRLEEISPKRNFKFDPYIQRADMIFAGGTNKGNLKGEVRTEDANKISLSSFETSRDQDLVFIGDLKQEYAELYDLVISKKISINVLFNIQSRKKSAKTTLTPEEDGAD